MALGYFDTDNAVRNHCKKVNDFNPGKSPGLSNYGQLELNPRGAYFIPESDLYRLIMRSKLPSAERFQDWVVEEVLLSIRKTGSYSVSGGISLPDFNNPAQLARAWADEYEGRALAEKQRDYYKETKAHIGTLREAKAMSTASSAVRQKNVVTNSYGVGPIFYAVRRIPYLKEYFNLTPSVYRAVGKRLSILSRKLKLDIKLSSESYPTTPISTYHQKAVDYLKEMLDTDPNMLGRWRHKS